MTKYQRQTRFLNAVDCIIFGFDGQHLKILLVKRWLEPKKDHWSLMGGFVQPAESTDEAATRVLKQLTGLDGVYLEQLHVFSAPDRDPLERTISTAYFALIDIHKYERQISEEYHAEWFLLNEIPELIFDHPAMVAMAKERLKYKAAAHPILFELLPEKFTLLQLMHLYEEILGIEMDKSNFRRKILHMKLLVALDEKQQDVSHRAAQLYKFDSEIYEKLTQKGFNFEF